MDGMWIVKIVQYIKKNSFPWFQNMYGWDVDSQNTEQIVQYIKNNSFPWFQNMYGWDVQ